MSDKTTKFANLRQGHPAKECIQGASEILGIASQNILTNPDIEYSLFQYGFSRGPPEFTEELAKFLTSEYGDKVSSEDLLVTCGASQGLHLLATSLFTKDNPVFVEELSYYHGTQLFKQLNMKVIPVPLDKDGLVVTELDRLLTKERLQASHVVTDDSRPYWSLAYLIPTFHNPTGICYSADRCKELIAVARKHKILLVCDDVYNLLHYTDSQAPPQRLLAYDHVSDTDFCGSVVSNCTFTKIFGPGLRLGWIETSPPVMKLILNCFVLRSGGCVNQYTARIMAEALRLGLETANMRRLRTLLKRRMEHLHEALKKFLPENCEVYTYSKGGYFVWVMLPENLDAEVLRTNVLNGSDVDFLEGIRCSSDEKCRNAFRLSISVCQEDQIWPGVQRLCEAIKNMTK
ncbi:uncharacterized protein LOC135480735 [Liolophura sinensis]|uniref:uncharacterized protein LOC135480735 n=1 Tax=Liolophura sinensis TaxID=3198878 RepID=UPI003158779A